MNHLIKNQRTSKLFPHFDNISCLLACLIIGYSQNIQNGIFYFHQNKIILLLSIELEMFQLMQEKYV